MMGALVRKALTVVVAVMLMATSFAMAHDGAASIVADDRCVTADVPHGHQHFEVYQDEASCVGWPDAGHLDAGSSCCAFACHAGLTVDCPDKFSSVLTANAVRDMLNVLPMTSLGVTLERPPRTIAI
jgi:hypothetical protein